MCKNLIIDHKDMDSQKIGEQVSFCEDRKVIAVLGGQWGDEGKGKIVDFLAQQADISIRFSGGRNAGHTLTYKEGSETKKIALHLVPSSIRHDADGVQSILGSGVLVDPPALLREIEDLKEAKISYDHFRIAFNAKLVMPQHIVMDCAKELMSGDGKIGTTKSGIGPVCSDHISRDGLIVAHLFNKDLLVQWLRRNVEFKKLLLESTDRQVIKDLMDEQGLGEFYSETEVFNEDAIIEAYTAYGETLKNLVCDTDALVQEALAGGRNILLEGAQAIGLDVSYGTYPYVTSSHASRHGIGLGSGLSLSDVDLCISAVKAPYMTRVGEGPFPTEIGGEESDKWCSVHTHEDEDAQYPDVEINDESDFHQGIAIRRVGDEYGATTGRPRRTGWLDLVFLKYMAQVNGPDVVLTKFDVMDSCKTIRLCDGYEYTGPDYDYGDKVITSGETFETIRSLHSDVLKYCKPLYKDFPGWQCDTTGVRKIADFPAQVRDIIDYIEEKSTVNVLGVSVGPERDQVAWK